MKMPRLSLKFLVKSFLLVMAVMFILPFLMSKIDSQESDKAKDNERKNIVKKDLGFQMEQGQQGNELQNHDNKDEHEQPNNEHHVEGAGAIQPPNVQSQQEHHKGPQGMQVDPDSLMPGQIPGKIYGPKAEYKYGTLGNYEPNIAAKSGPGENGEAVYVSMSEKQAGDRSVQEFGFNMVASDKIAMDRTIPDTRHEECKYWHYPEQLPTASVIIVFHNEGWSTLMRTVHSVINMSPVHLLHEVVMVDDFSSKDHLKGKLENYIKQFNGKVKLYRNKERLGLIRTRSNGAKYSTGDVIVFLDAHCECNKDWLPPLLARIAYDRTIMAVPIIDGIDWDNFRYRPVYTAGNNFRGIFEWGFLYKESSVPRKELDKRSHGSEPYWAPTHAGGLFAMDRKYFHELGEYDEGLQIWGGENFELSFKIWLCGGSIEWVPCSRVGHVYRNSMPYGFGNINPKIPVVQLNYMRVVEVWLDDFKEYFYTREPMIEGYPIGNISKQVDFRKKNCPHSFKWFMDNVAYEVYDKFPPPPRNQAWGEIKLWNNMCWDSVNGEPTSKLSLRKCIKWVDYQIVEKHGSSCWDSMNQNSGGSPIGIFSCHHTGGNQLFRLNEQGQMGIGERCIDIQGGHIKVVYCSMQPSGPWSWNKSTGLIKHSRTGQCVEGHSNENKLSLVTCDQNSKTQQWTINPVWTWK